MFSHNRKNYSIVVSPSSPPSSSLPPPSLLPPPPSPHPGHFLFGDKARCILEAKMGKEGVLCLVGWRRRRNGILPPPSLLLSKEVRRFDKQILINFYEWKAKMNAIGLNEAGFEGNFGEYKTGMVLAESRIRSFRGRLREEKGKEGRRRERGEIEEEDEREEKRDRRTKDEKMKDKEMRVQCTRTYDRGDRGNWCRGGGMKSKNLLDQFAKGEET